MYLGISDEYPLTERLSLAKKWAQENDIQFTFWRADDLTIFIEPTDMHFIDSLHTYCHFTYELECFSPQVRKYICLHDVCDPWGSRDDNMYHGDYSEYLSSYDRNKRGL
jgi:hypothetical protein